MLCPEAGRWSVLQGQLCFLGGPTLCQPGLRDLCGKEEGKILVFLDENRQQHLAADVQPMYNQKNHIHIFIQKVNNSFLNFTANIITVVDFSVM